MKKYTFQGKHPRYRITVGVDRPLATLFAQVGDLAWQGQGIDEYAEVDSPEEGLLMWVGTCFHEIQDVQQLAQAVAPYGQIPLPLQIQLIHDLDQVEPLPLMVLGTQLAAVCKQSPSAIFTQELEPQKRYYLFLNHEGWHLCEWGTESVVSMDQTFASLIYPSDEPAPQYPEILTSYVSDPSILFFIDEYGFAKRLPVFALLARGTMLSGPVVISNENQGVTPKQIRTIQQEVLFVDETLRPAVTDLWYYAWRTLRMRGFTARN